MDPEACLEMVKNSLEDGDLEAAKSSLGKYYTWRARGGFEPENGDERAFKFLQDVKTMSKNNKG